LEHGIENSHRAKCDLDQWQRWKCVCSFRDKTGEPFVAAGETKTERRIGRSAAGFNFGQERHSIADADGNTDTDAKIDIYSETDAECEGAAETHAASETKANAEAFAEKIGGGESFAKTDSGKRRCRSCEEGIGAGHIA